MIKLNNKGQSLVMFVLIIPILFFLLIIVVDIGNIFLEKQELDNLSYLTLDYGLDNYDRMGVEPKMKQIINKNDSKIEDIEILFSDDKIIIRLKKNISGILVKNLNILDIKSEYVGYISNGKKVIERVWYYG